VTRVTWAVAEIIGQDGLPYTIGLAPEINDDDGSTTGWTVLAHGGEPPETFDPAVGTFRTVREAVEAIRQAWGTPTWELKMIETATPATWRHGDETQPLKPDCRFARG